MEKLNPSEYAAAARLLNPESSGAVYPLSVLEGIQQGEVYRIGGAVLVWHYAGFAFLSGEWDARVLQDIYTGFLCRPRPGRRFVLFVSDEETVRCFREMPGCTAAQRLFFTYRGDCSGAEPVLPAPLQCRRIDGAILPLLHGNVTPHFSWKSGAAFLEKGRGFCITDGETPASWAFSAAVSHAEIDIGIETAEPFRHRGLAAAAADRMVRECLAQEKRPVWACNAENTASRRVAEKLGFVKTGECILIRKP